MAENRRGTHPVVDEKDLDLAIAEIYRILDSDEPQDAEYLDALSDAVEAYETVHYPMPAVSDAQMLAFLLENRGGVSTAEVASKTGVPDDELKAILAGSAPAAPHAEALALYFHVGAAVFTS